jgi:hypothetical protein
MRMLDYIREACMRHDTAVALAFRRALGLPAAPPRPTARTHAEHGVYDGIRGCMAQMHGVRQ